MSPQGHVGALGTCGGIGDMWGHWGHVGALDTNKIFPNTDRMVSPPSVKSNSTNTDKQSPALCRPVLADTRQNTVVRESSHISPACPSDKGNVRMQLSTELWREY